ncbi:MAG TPA: ribosome maturation factor RimM [Nevskiaceae bacterium]|nr:ribosome maturation factor RimM [Nevskiaceae bacterium]
MTHRVTLGRVAGVFGVRGWVKLQSYTRPIDNLLDYPVWWLGGDGGYAASWRGGRPQGPGLVAQLVDRDGQWIESRELAERLIGAELQVERDQLPRLPAGQYYWADLLGLEVCNEQGERLGEVDHLTSNGAQDVLAVKEAGALRLIPFVQGPLVKSVDLASRRIVVDWQRDW